MKLKKFLKENKKGFLYSSLAVILGYPLLYLFQFKGIVPIENILYVIPISFSMTFMFMMIFGLIIGDKE